MAEHRNLAHELGHFFGLAHTHNNSNASDVAQRELVTRNPNEVSPRLPANCTTAGDYICDTPADPRERGSNAVLSDCVSGTGIAVVDANNDAYAPSTVNLMSYYFCQAGALGQEFTPGQVDRMQSLGVPTNTDPTNDYSLTGCPVTAQAPPSNVTLTLVSPSASFGVNLSWTDNSSVETGYIIERSTQSTTGFVPITGVDANVTSYQDRTTEPGVRYYYRIKASNTQTTYNTSIPSITTPPICSAPYSRSCITNRNIESVRIADQTGQQLLFNNGSGCGSVFGYSDFTALSPPTLTPGSTYSFTVVTTVGGSFYGQKLGIWLDADNNKTLEPDELVYQYTGRTNPGTRTQNTFTVPTDARACSQVRLRIRAVTWNELSGPVTDPCFQYSSGETEDYTVSISGDETITSIASGEWTNPTVWACGRVPNQNDLVIISPGYTISLPAGYTAQARQLRLQGKLVESRQSRLQLGN